MAPTIEQLRKTHSAILNGPGTKADKARALFAAGVTQKARISDLLDGYSVGAIANALAVKGGNLATAKPAIRPTEKPTRQAPINREPVRKATVPKATPGPVRNEVYNAIMRTSWPPFRWEGDGPSFPANYSEATYSDRKPIIVRGYAYNPLVKAGDLPMPIAVQIDEVEAVASSTAHRPIKALQLMGAGLTPDQIRAFVPGLTDSSLFSYYQSFHSAIWTIRIILSTYSVEAKVAFLKQLAQSENTSFERLLESTADFPIVDNSLLASVREAKANRRS